MKDLKQELLIIVKNNLKECELPEFFYEYISEIILEDPPSTVDDLLNLIKDFLNNKTQMEYSSQLSICDNIFKEIKYKNIISKDNNNLSFTTDKLEAPVIMKNTSLISNNEIISGYTDTPFLIERLLFSNSLIQDSNQVKEMQKKIEERRKKEKEKTEELAKIEYEKNVEKMKSHLNRLPPVEITHSKSNYSIEINVDKFSLDIGGKVLLEDARLLLAVGRKYGFVGRNGTGKTSLLYAIIKKEIEGMNKDPQILMVEQELAGTEKTVLEVILEADVERDSLLKEEKELLDSGSNEERLNEIYERLIEIEADSAEGKAITLLKGLGFTDKMIMNKTLNLSGGWRMRLSLAKVLFCKPDILLLDEPTNHLDLDAVLWLQDYLQNWDSTLLVVSHAREFLNTVCTDIVYLNNQKLEYYKGNYDNFIKTKNERDVQLKKDIENQKNKISHMKEFIDRFRAKASRASLVQSRIKALERIEVPTDIKEDPSYVFNFGEPEKCRPPCLRIDNGFFRYDKDNNNSENILENLNFSIDMESKVALLGSNGAGKTTFLKLLLKELELIDGEYYKNGNCRVSFFSQHHVEKLDLAISAIEQFIRYFPTATIEQIRGGLSKFGIVGDVALRPMYVLSGGQKSRVSLALVAWNNPQILIMDEPTNHLDIEAINSLIMALNEYTGGIIIVSHDQYFVSCVCDHIWYIKNKKLKRFNGDFESYRLSLAANTL